MYLVYATRSLSHGDLHWLGLEPADPGAIVRRLVFICAMILSRRDQRTELDPTTQRKLSQMRCDVLLMFI